MRTSARSVLGALYTVAVSLIRVGQLLERMPPIEVFAGLEQLLSSEPVKGLPSRKQLADWLVEHDAIEKETEQFDSGDMIRLKKFAKGTRIVTPTVTGPHTTLQPPPRSTCRPQTRTS